MSNIKAINMVWLSKADLCNINSGEGGGGNIVELKTYDGGRKPYASGQSVRHALREAIQREYPDAFKSTPEFPSSDIENDWLSDLFGYLDPKAGEGFDRRWSPIKVTPALGQTTSEIVTDLLLRMSIKDKASDDPDKVATKDQRLAYVQLAETIFRTGMSIDVANVGRVVIPEVAKERKGEKDIQVFKGYAEKKQIGPDKRQERVVAALEAVGRLCDFAKQARNAISLSPDVLLIALLPVYSQRGLRALSLNDEGILNLEELSAIVEDLRSLSGQLFFGYTPGVIANDGEFKEWLQKSGIESTHPMGAINKAVAYYRG
ncbi:MAG TPA: type I-B CRISPR-associated protein Cas7/Cst2/DevR [Abditibacteriaceae bacterium]